MMNLILYGAKGVLHLVTNIQHKFYIVKYFVLIKLQQAECCEIFPALQIKFEFNVVLSNSESRC